MLNCIHHYVRLLIAASVAFAAHQAHAQPATLALDDIIDGCQATETRWKELKDWRIEYQHIPEVESPAPEGAVRETRAVEKVNARRGNWLYSYEKQALSRQANPDALFTDSHEYWILWKDGVCLERQGKDVSILPEPSGRAYQVFYFTAWLGLDLQSDMDVRSEHLRKIFKSSRPSDLGKDWYLPRCLIEHRAEYKVRPTLEVIDGHPCHVIERTNQDVIWIDPAIGFMIRRRVLYHSAGRLSADVSHKGYEQKAPGIWIPRQQTSLAYDVELPPEEYRPEVHQMVKQQLLIAAQFNDVPDSVFSVPVPDGVTVHDFIRGITYEKLKPAEDPAEQGLEKALLDMSYGPQPARRWDWLDVALMVGVGGELIWTGLLIRRRRERVQPS